LHVRAVNVMSWNNPTQDEASEEYYSSKSKYSNAASQRYAATRAAENCSAEKYKAQCAIQSCMNDKINFEKRIDDIKAIIGMISGTGGGFFGSEWGNLNLPEAIASFNSHSQKTDESFRASMKCSDIIAASIHEVFKSKTVDEDVNLSDALQQFKNELARLEQALKDLQAQINSLSNLVNELTSKISSFNAEAMNWRKVMVSSAYEMNHFKSYM